MWTTKTTAPPTRYEAIIRAIELTDEAIKVAIAKSAEIILLSQRSKLVEALVDGDDEDDEERASGPWKCNACGQTGDTEETLVEGFLCPACSSARVTYNATEET
jgi:predicted Zn-ribbon and HTH transcriptional regulator